LQFNTELNSTQLKLAEEVEASSDMAARTDLAEGNMKEMAMALSIAVQSCQNQKAARIMLKRKLEEKENVVRKIAKELEVANLQVQTRVSMWQYSKAKHHS
jgi:hypothetical protein